MFYVNVSYILWCCYIVFEITVSSSCVKVVDCRICGDPHSVLRFAFVEFADDRKFWLLDFLKCYNKKLSCHSYLMTHTTKFTW